MRKHLAEQATAEATALHKQAEAMRCPWRESGGVQCELADNHESDGLDHWISRYTIDVLRFDNGYMPPPCSRFLAELRQRIDAGAKS